MAETNIFPQPPIRQSDQTSACSLPVATVPDLATFRTVDERGEKKSAALRQHIDEPPAPVSGTVVAFPGQTNPELPDQPLRREWLTELEVEQLCAEARKRGRYGHRDATMQPRSCGSVFPVPSCCRRRDSIRPGRLFCVLAVVAGTRRRPAASVRASSFAGFFD